MELVYERGYSNDYPFTSNFKRIRGRPATGTFERHAFQVRQILSAQYFFSFSVIVLAQKRAHEILFQKIIQMIPYLVYLSPFPFFPAVLLLFEFSLKVLYFSHVPFLNPGISYSEFRDRDAISYGKRRNLVFMS